MVRKENDSVTLTFGGFIDSPQGYTDELIEIEIGQTGTIIKVEENDFYHVQLDNDKVILIEEKDLQTEREEIDKIIEKEGYENLRHNWKN